MGKKYKNERLDNTAYFWFLSGIWQDSSCNDRNSIQTEKARKRFYLAYKIVKCVCVCVFSYSWTQVLIPLGNHSISWLYVPLCRFHSQAACSLWWPLVSPDLYPNGLAVLTFLRDLAKTPGLNLISLTWVIYSLLSQSVYLKWPGSLDSLELEARTALPYKVSE